MGSISQKVYSQNSNDRWVVIDGWLNISWITTLNYKSIILKHLLSRNCFIDSAIS